MSEHERRQRTDSHPSELVGDVRFGWPLIDEDPGARCLEENRVSLPHVQERHPEPRRFLPGRGYAQRPRGRDRHERSPSRGEGECTAGAADPASAVPGGDPGRGTDEHRHERRACVDLRPRQRSDETRDELEPRRRPARQPGEGRRGSGRDGIRRGGEQSQAEHRGHRRKRQGIRRNGVDGCRTEVKEDDRRGDETANQGYAEHIAGTAWNRISVQARVEARNAHEDSRDSGERELEAGLEQRGRRPGQQHERPHGEEVPPVARPRREPGERRERAGDSGADHGRLPADREHVRGDRPERHELPDDSRDPEQPAEPEDADGDVRDVLAGDRQKMRKARCPEVLLDVFRQSFVLAEDDPENQSTPDSLGSAPDRTLDSIAKTIAASGDAATTAELAPRAPAENDVDPLAREPGTLVEASGAVCDSRLGHADDRLQDGTPRRRPTYGERQKHPFAQMLPAEASDLGRNPDCPRRRACRSRHYELRPPGLAHVGEERAVPHRVQS